jgi:Flp pilus assembly protein TadG
MRRLLRHSTLHTRQRGQALVFVALLLTFLSMLVLTCIEVAARYQELAQIEDALKQATRSSVQAFDYAAFAQNGQHVRETSGTTVTGCASLAANSARKLACTVFTTNAAGVGGMQETPEQAAARITWTFLPQGGTCTFPNGHPPVTFTTPAVCATMRPRMTGLLGWGSWTPQVDAADTLDHLGN